MKTQDNLPIAGPDISLYDSLAIMTQKRIGLVIIINEKRN